MTRNKCNRHIRLALDMSQSELAKRIGVTRQAVCNYEHRENKHSTLLQKRIERILDDAVDESGDETIKVICETYQYCRKRGL